MPCKVYSGIEPPAALVEEMFKRQQNPSSGLPYQASTRPPRPPQAAPAQPPSSSQVDASSQLPAYSPAAPGAAVSAGPIGAGATGAPLPEEAPPSYEDAMGEDIGPVDGPRAQYEQPQSAPVVGDEKRGSLFNR